MQVRPATMDDARDIARIHVRAWQVAYRGLVAQSHLDSLSVDRREAAWRKNLASPTTQTSVAIDEGKVCGWISVGGCRDEDVGPEVAELWAIYVDPDHWRRGAGRALWDEAAQALASSGFREAVLWSLEDNAPALAFYRSLGFTPEPGLVKSFERDGVALQEIRLRGRLRR
jgi:ribosomal protein S18 acetylase RimI-like enzyme